MSGAGAVIPAASPPVGQQCLQAALLFPVFGPFSGNFGKFEVNPPLSRRIG
jgi:hypothetical protein